VKTVTLCSMFVLLTSMLECGMLLSIEGQTSRDKEIENDRAKPDPQNIQTNERFREKNRTMGCAA
jgi:hypothetical protein